MIGLKSKSQLAANKIHRRVEQASFKNLGHAGAVIRLTARRSIRRRKRSSAPGSAPNTQTGRLKQSLRYSVERDRQLVVIGTDAALIGQAGSAHEHGGRYKREKYPRRPFIGPALVKNIERLPKLWRTSIQS